MKSLKTFLVILVLLLFSARTFAGNFYSRQSGNWTTLSTWSTSSGGGAATTLPTSADNIIIEGGFTVTVNSTVTCASLQIGSPNTTKGGAGTLTFSGTNTLTVTNSVIVGGYGNTNRNGTITFTSTSTLTAGNITMGGTGTTPASGTITMVNGSALNTGTFTVNTAGGTWTPSTGTVTLKSASTLPSSIFTTFYNLIVDPGTGNITSSGAALTINGDLTINTGTLIFFQYCRQLYYRR